MNPTSGQPFGPSLFSARVKVVPEDFIVEEIAAEPPTGEGEHLMLWVEKRGLATTDVVQRLSHWAGIAPVGVGFAGMKDKQALTRQRFTVHLPRRVAPDTAALEGEGLRVLSQAWHARKLPRGGLAGNAFVIALRGLRDHDGVRPQAELREAIAARLATIAQRGMPNRFGMQRFGRFGDNVGQARRMFAGAKVGRETRSMLLSAARAELFNRVLDRRVDEGHWDRILPGEVCMLDGRKSVFGPEPPSAAIEARAAAFDLHPTGPLWGRGALRTAEQAHAIEAAVAAAEPALCQGLEAAGLVQERRALRVRPEALAADWAGEDDLVLRFRLPAGSYATALLACLCGEDAGGAD